MDPNNTSQTLYNAYLFKNPGMRRWIRHKAHGWGVDKMNSIIKKDLADDLRAKLSVTKEKALELTVAAKEKVVEKVVDSAGTIKEITVTAKDKVVDSAGTIKDITVSAKDKFVDSTVHLKDKVIDTKDIITSKLSYDSEQTKVSETQQQKEDSSTNQ